MTLVILLPARTSPFASGGDECVRADERQGLDTGHRAEEGVMRPYV